jgi:hypothetical protein
MTPGRPGPPRAALLAVLLVALWAGACSGQSESMSLARLTIDPAMVRGPADAVVTIVEFSDYE